jgi:hypothetical protein
MLKPRTAAPKALHALTIASAKHLLKMGHIAKPKHDKIVKQARMSIQQAPMPAQQPDDPGVQQPDFGSLAPMMGPSMTGE